MRASPVPNHHPELVAAITAEIDAAPGNSIPFVRFMELALYHPQHGYYVSGKRRTGRDGDFFTSVSVGECFGMLLAMHAASAPGNTLIEQGANDAQLAIDILRHSADGTQYIIVEPSSALRAIQEEKLRLAGFAEQCEIVSSLDAIKPVDAIFLSNELLDAFPVHRVRFDGQKWEEIHVTRDFSEITKPIDSSALADAVLEIGTVPPGYTTEINLAADQWIADAARVLRSGTISVIDYGHESDAYYAPSRTTGTLRCYRKHQADEDPYTAIGETDITAHVNFTRLRRAAEAAGLHFQCLTDQHRFTIRTAEPWLRSIEGKAEAATLKLIRQFQTLSHPTIMGSGFHVATFRREPSPPSVKK